MYWKGNVKNFRRLKVVVLDNIYNDLVKRKNQKVEVDKKGAAPNTKCKECGMESRNKGTLEIHRKKAHSDKGERKKPS
jgi:hypothetical protein